MVLLSTSLTTEVWWYLWVTAGRVHSFEGPIYNQAGELVVAEGEVADDGMLAGMNFYVQGMKGDLPQ